MASSDLKNVREIVLENFHLLLIEVGFSALTVQHILDKANIGRTTFYAHFTNKEDVLKQSVNRLRDGLLAAVEQNHFPQAATTKFQFAYYFFAHIGSHHQIYDHLVGRDDFFVVEKYILRMLHGLVLNELAEECKEHKNSIQLELIAQHIVGAIWATGIWWLERKQLSAQEMNDSFQSMIECGLDSTLEKLKSACP